MEDSYVLKLPILTLHAYAVMVNCRISFSVNKQDRNPNIPYGTHDFFVNFDSRSKDFRCTKDNGV